MKDKVMSNLEAARKSKDITLADIADLFGYRYATVSEKINGKSEFKFSEAVKIRKTFFPEYDLEYLFEREDTKRPA